MAGNISMNVITGVQKIMYAIMTDVVEQTYGTVKELADLMEISVTPSENTGSTYAGNKEILVETALAGIEAGFTIPSMSTEAMVDLFGAEEASEGGIIQSSKHVKPYIALMFEKTLDGGAIEYTTLYKGKLNVAEDKGKTQEGNVEFQSKQYSGKFIPLENGMWIHTVRTTDTGFNPTTWTTKWGKQVVIATPKSEAMSTKTVQEQVKVEVKEEVQAEVREEVKELKIKKED